MSARSPAISAEALVVMAMSAPCGEPASGHSTKRMRCPCWIWTTKPSARLALRRVEAGLTEVPRITVDSSAAARLRRGQPVLLRGQDAPFDGSAYAACGGVVVAIGAIENGELIPGRVFNLPF